MRDMFGGQIGINKEKNHAVLMLNGRCYDITGEIKDTREYRKAEMDEIAMMKKWSFSKKMILGLNECEFCGEPVKIIRTGELKAVSDE